MSQQEQYIKDLMSRINMYFDRIEIPIQRLTKNIQKRIDTIKDRSKL